MIVHLSDGTSRIELKIETALGSAPILSLPAPVGPAANTKQDTSLLSMILGRPLLLGGVAVLGFALGAFSTGRSGPAAAVQPAAAGPAETQAARPEIPADLRQQLQQKPNITPPPAATAPPGKNPFGLE